MPPLDGPVTGQPVACEAATFPLPTGLLGGTGIGPVVVAGCAGGAGGVLSSSRR
jgi:hypothetical protein